ncbi:DMT family transporter [Halodurantibacterium flavum]|uniref:DMT family transporter n=1 Tax=Halodurantibacterium flavum TaxID=1382802 RepID=A0ABW4S4R2_9RHOB
MSWYSSLGPNARGILLMLCAIFIFTVMDALAKSLIVTYGPVQVVWARYAGQAAIILVLLAPRLPRLLQTNHLGLHGMRSVFQVGATALFFASLPHIGLAEATAIMDINPVLITLAAALFLGERIGPRRLFGVLAAMVGALIIIQPGSGVFSPAALLPLAGAICYTGHAITTRMLGTGESIWTALLYTALIGTVLTTAALPLGWTTPALADLPGLLAIGGIGAAGQLCLIRAFSSAEAGVVAPFAYVGLLFATLWGVLLFDEYPDFWTGVGALVIVAAGLYVWHRETRGTRQGGAEPVADRMGADGKG